MCVVYRMTGAQVHSVVLWLFGCSLIDLLVVLFVPLFLSFLAVPGLCYFRHVTHGKDWLVGSLPVRGDADGRSPCLPNVAAPVDFDRQNI